MERLRQRSDFLAAAAGVKVATPAFVLQARQRSDEGPVRVGFTVSKKVGNAPERNRVRRRLREIFRRGRLQLTRPGLALVVNVRQGAADASFEELANDYKGALDRGLSRLSRPT